MELSDSQKLAVETRGVNLVVVAGAGSGKTRVLVERYLRLLEEGCALPRIVAITFTEKAAGEMRDRVRLEIERHTSEAVGDARARWEVYRREIDAAQISTIHSLCARLLRANPVEARVDPRFEVLEEADAAIWQGEALDDMLADLAEHGGPEIRLLDQYSIRDAREAMAQFLGRGAMIDEAFGHVPASADALVEEWRKGLEQAQGAGLERLLGSKTWCDAARWVLNNSATDSKDKLEIIRAEDEALLNSLDGSDLVQAFGVIREFSRRPKVGSSGSAKVWEDVKYARQQLNVLREQARDFAKTYDLTVGDDDRRAAEMILLWRGLWKRVRDQYERRKDKMRVLDFDDLEAKTRELLRNCSEVRERYRQEFACVLVDEFQDTNAAQRDIIYGLADPSQPDRLFIVGDGKQSIYGFRGADVSVFNTVLDDMVTRWGKKARIPLVESFRAHARLVKCFDHVFSRLFQVEGKRASFEVEYEAMKGVRGSPKREPLMEIIRVPSNNGDEKIPIAERRGWEARELASRLRELIDQRFQVWDKEREAYRDAQWRDVALLFRASGVFPIFEEAFKDAGIPYLTFAGQGYYDRPEVRDLIHLLRALDNPNDDLALAVALHSPLYALSGETLYWLRRDRKHLREALENPPDSIPGEELARVAFARGSLNGLWKLVRRVPILELLKRAIDDTDYLATVAALSDGERRRGNVEKLLALARRTGLVRLSEFNAYLQDLTAQEVREGEALVEAGNAVLLMTIHRAKGLEFPIVVIPDASRGAHDSNDLLLVDREAGVATAVRDARGKRVEPAGYKLMALEADRRGEAEEKRLLYVAATRAQDYVVVSGGEKAGGKSYLKWALDALEDRSVFPWGTVLVREPGLGFHDRPAYAMPYAGTGSRPEVASSCDLGGLARPLPSPGTSDLRSFTATGLERLVVNRAAFEQKVLEGAPERVPAVTRSGESPRAPGYVIGELAHRAIQRWRFPHTTPDLDMLLELYAREQGLTDPRELGDAVREARMLLEKFTRSEMYHAIASARTRRQEVPFVVQWEGRLVNGTLDVLCETEDRGWLIADLKTDRFREKGTDPRSFTLKNYAVQMALYHKAVEAQFGVDAQVRVHYIREDKTVDLSGDELAEALARAQAAIGAGRATKETVS